MRRTVWIVVLGLLVLAVVAQSVALVQQRSADEFTEFQVGPDGRIVKVRTLSSRYGVTTSQAESTQKRGQASSKRARIQDDQEVIQSWTIQSKMYPDKDAAMKDAIEQAQNRLMHDLWLTIPPSADLIRNRMMNHFD